MPIISDQPDQTLTVSNDDGHRRSPRKLEPLHADAEEANDDRRRRKKKNKMRQRLNRSGGEFADKGAEERTAKKTETGNEATETSKF